MTDKLTYEELEQRILELQQAEKEKIETEKKFDVIFNHRFQLTGLLDINGKLLMANENVHNMVGVDRNEIIGKYLWQLPHWSHSKEQQLKIKNAVLKVKKGNLVSFETTHVDSRGDVKDIKFSLTPVHDDDGNLVYIVPEGRDITERKQSEKKLIESERNYREIYNSTSEAFFIHDEKTGKILDVNQAMLKMYGYTYQEALKLEIGDLSSGELSFTLKEAVKKIRKAVNEGIQLFEWMARRKNGSLFWVEVALRKTQIGGKGRVLSVVRDITQRKRLDSELKLAKHSIEHSAFPFEWIQKDGRFIYVNEATCRSLGYSREEFYTMRVSDIDPQVEPWAEFWNKLKLENSLTFETNHRRKNGEIFPVEITANYLEIEGKEHVFAYVKDISERVQYENEQKNLEKQLQQAQKMEAIGHLAGGVAHDFNNMLSIILGYSELILQKVDPAQPIYAKLEQIRKAGERLLI